MKNLKLTTGTANTLINCKEVAVKNGRYDGIRLFYLSVKRNIFENLTVTKTKEKVSTTYYSCEDRFLGKEIRTESVGLLMTEACMKNALHTLLIKSGWKPFQTTSNSVWNSANAVTYMDGKVVRQVFLNQY